MDVAQVLIETTRELARVRVELDTANAIIRGLVPEPPPPAESAEEFADRLLR